MKFSLRIDTDGFNLGVDENGFSAKLDRDNIQADAEGTWDEVKSFFEEEETVSAVPPKARSITKEEKVLAARILASSMLKRNVEDVSNGN